MQRFFAFLFITLLLSKFIYSCFWQLHFYMNQKEITRLECENKNRPELKCNGKCYLAKQLQKADEHLNYKKSENDRSAELMKSIEGSSFLAPEFFLCNFPNFYPKGEIISKNINKKSSPHLIEVFHPPC